MKIQFGCGGNFLTGWKNHDYDVNIIRPLPYGDAVADFVFIEHCIEHVTGPEAFRFMKEVRRILKDGGTFRVCVPELARLDREAAEDIIVNHGHLQVFSEETLRLMLQTAGFRQIVRTERSDIDSHWRVIGKEKDDKETLRMEAVK
jgi:predicted SAM-dependent methyltransferase